MGNVKVLIIAEETSEICLQLQTGLRAKGVATVFANNLTSVCRHIDEGGIRIVLCTMYKPCEQETNHCCKFFEFVSEHFSSELRPKFWAGIQVSPSSATTENAASSEIDIFSWPFSMAVIVDYCCDRLFHNREIDFYLDPVHMQVVFPKGSSVSLTGTEFQILSLFRESQELRICREEVGKRIWRSNKTGAKTLEMHISQLRRKFKPQGLKINYLGNSEYGIMENKNLILINLIFILWTNFLPIYSFE